MNYYNETLYLPEGLRNELKKSWGTAILGEPHEVFNKCRQFLKNKNFKKVITVGDFCSMALPSDVKIFDGKVERKTVENNLSYSLECGNPAGTIDESAWEAVGQAIRENKNLFVRGEEDLLVIPAVILAEEGSAVVYGLPQKGLCAIEVSPEIKNSFKVLLEKFSVKPLQ